MKRKEKRNKFLKAESGFPQSLRMTEEITKENNPSIYISGVKMTILSLLNTKNVKEKSSGSR